jgi:hypothetical protein
MNREERVEAARVGDIVGIVKGQSHPIPIDEIRSMHR